MGDMDKDSAIQALKAHVGDDITEAQIDAVLAAQRAIADGDPVGTVRKDPDTGKVAHRVTVHGVTQWRITDPHGDQYNDLQPTLPWPALDVVDT